jgi:amino acid transporter
VENKFKTLLFGKPRNLSDRSVFHRLSLVAFFAWVGLGADGLSSSCYGPPEAFLALGSHFHLAIFVALGTAITIFIVSASYSQIIDLFPSGGGGYLVASKLLTPTAGMVSGCALLIDYVLTIAVSVATGVDAIYSVLKLEGIPQVFLDTRLTAIVMVVILLSLLNMRGVKESVIPLVPIFLVFVLTHAFVIVYAIVVNADELPQVAQSTIQTVHDSSATLGTFGMIVLIMRAYSMGAGTFTGIEAVSNGIPILREPRAQTAKSTMRYMAWSLAFTAMGLMIAYILYSRGSLLTAPKNLTLNAALFSQMTEHWPALSGHVFWLVALLSEGAILFVAAQSGFLDGPRVMANMALDRWLPTRLSILSERLVTSNGIVFMGAAAVAVLLWTGGDVLTLLVLYSINVFLTFVLSQLGMVRHWWQARKSESRWLKSLAINGTGLVLCTGILISTVVIKFGQGGWMTLVITGSLVLAACLIRRHYHRVQAMLARLNVLTASCEKRADEFAASGKTAPAYDPRAKTAVLLVSGFNGIGLHSLLNTIRFFGDSFHNFIFVQVGMIDAGNFKGAEEIQHLQAHTSRELDKYVNFCRSDGYFADSSAAIGVDLLEEIDKLAPEILRKYPEAVFFGGQLVFPQDSIFSRWLHNATVFAVQRRFYSQGVPFMVLPIRV